MCNVYNNVYHHYQHFDMNIIYSIFVIKNYANHFICMFLIITGFTLG